MIYKILHADSEIFIENLEKKNKKKFFIFISIY